MKRAKKEELWKGMYSDLRSQDPQFFFFVSSRCLFKNRYFDYAEFLQTKVQHSRFHLRQCLRTDVDAKGPKGCRAGWRRHGDRVLVVINPALNPVPDRCVVVRPGWCVPRRCTW